jgi:hypothetical protein
MVRYLAYLVLVLEILNNKNNYLIKVKICFL